MKARIWGILLVAALVFISSTLVAASTASAHNTPWGQGESEPKDLVISLVTFSPGDEVAQWFGHSGLMVEDRRLNRSRLYNYGMFSFDDGLLFQFAMGRLWFWVAPTHVPSSFNTYIRQDRDVRVIEFNLPEEKRAEVAEFLSDNVRPENREYLYHHYDDNCSTRIRDVIDLAVDGQFSDAYEDKPGRMTLRDHTRRHSAHLPPMDWLLMYLMNGTIDEPTTVWQEMFLPEELEDRVLEFEWEDPDGQVRPLALREHEVYRAEDRPPPPEEPPTHWPWWLLAGMALGAVGVAIGLRGRRRPGRASRIAYGCYHLSVGLLLGLVGLLLGVMAIGTEHTVTYWNQNLFWANPLTLVAVPLAVMVLRGSVTARGRLVQLWTLLAGIAAVGVVVNLIGFVVPALYQDTSIPIALFLPIIAGATVCAWLVDGGAVRDELLDEDSAE